MEKQREERVNHPTYYQGNGENGIEVIDVIRHYTCDVANALKYLMRAGRKQEDGLTAKEKELEDLRKALWYIYDYCDNCKTACVGMASARVWNDDTDVLVGRLLSKYTAQRVKSIADVIDGIDCADIRKAVALLMRVGFIYDCQVVVPRNWQELLTMATNAIEQRILSIEADLLQEEAEKVKLAMQGVAIEGENYIKEPGGNRETEPDAYDPMNMITVFGRSYCLTKDVRRKTNGALHTPCENCDLQEYCFDDWRHPDEKTCRYICTRLHQAETNEYYCEVGVVHYKPSNGTVEIVDEHKEMALELKRLEEENPADTGWPAGK